MSVETALNKLNVQELRAVGRLLFITELGLTKQQYVRYINLRLEVPASTTKNKQQIPKQTPRRLVPGRRSSRSTTPRSR